MKLHFDCEWRVAYLDWSLTVFPDVWRAFGHVTNGITNVWENGEVGSSISHMKSLE